MDKGSKHAQLSWGVFPEQYGLSRNMREGLSTSVGASVLLLFMIGLLVVSLAEGSPEESGEKTAIIKTHSLPDVASVSDIAEVIRAANPGDVIDLPAQAFGHLNLTGVHFTEPVIIDGKAGASFSKITLREVRNLYLRNIIVKAGTTSNHLGEFAVTVMRSRGVQISDSDISWSADKDWTNDGTGMTARLSTDVVIEDTIFHHSFTGLVIRDAGDIKIRKNTFRDLRRDGINVSGTVDIDIDQNVCTDFHPERPKDHPDCIQLWNDTAIRSNENIRITANNIIRGDGGVSQGIFLAGQKPGLPHRNVLIDGNLIHQGMGQGIFLRKVEGAVVRNNIVQAAPPVEHTPVITLRAPLKDIRVEANRAARIDVAPEVLRSEVLLLNNGP
ncbi:MAG: right-handed parallel beta-helix repeat-containing protein [Aquisalinus sp.]|nr:right-handed parallel beta-helix repeat-containing protein [Aquisalinus sp.]